MTQTAAPAIFLHSAFRSASTWFWSRFRALPGTLAYYEPFHEMKGSLTPEHIAHDRPDIWASGHGYLAEPYNQEYLDLLAPAGGVPFYQERFAYDDYYAPPDDRHHRYIEALVDHAGHLNKVPVFGFTRSLGRAAWMAKRYPGLHVVTLRDPWDLWASVVEQSARGNTYFDFRFYLLAAIASHHAEHRAFFDGLSLPRPSGETPRRTMDFVHHFFRATPAKPRFRAFLRLYMLDNLLALPNADVIVDMDRLSGETAYRQATTAELRRKTGFAGLDFEQCAMPRHPPEADLGYRVALAEALTVLDRLAPADNRGAPILRAKLEDALRRFARGPASNQAT